jgi:hypothetical protein
VGFGRSVRSLNKVKKNFRCEQQSKEPLEYIIKHSIVRQGETMVDMNEEIDLSMRDLYNRDGQLKNAIGRVSLLPERILYMPPNGLKIILWYLRYFRN